MYICAHIMSVNDYKYVWTVVTFSAYNTCKHTIFRCCFNLFLRRFALFCFAFDFVLPSTFWGFSHTIHSLPSPLSHALSFFHHHCFPSLSFAAAAPSFPTASVFAAYTQNATANFQLRHERELTSLLRSRSLAFALSLPPPPLSLDASPSQLHMKPAQLQLL